MQLLRMCVLKGLWRIAFIYCKDRDFIIFRFGGDEVSLNGNQKEFNKFYIFVL